MKKKPINLHDEIVVDSFAGGGGASEGMTEAGCVPDVAINHDEAAIVMHRANHPRTTHYTESVWKVSPHTVTKGRPVGLLWASPDCCHFSRAKGAKPVKKEIRSLAWVVIKWAAEVRPRVIMLENVREFEDWGPLLPKLVNGKAQYLEDGSPVLVPDPNRRGHSFNRWVGRLKAMGYVVQWRVLNAADFGAPTHRRRLFVVARCDGQPIVWPEPTHCEPKNVGKKWWYDGKDHRPIKVKRQPYRTAAECIDWSLPCHSIFMTPEEAKPFGVKRPLADNTLRRIAMGIKRYVLDNPEPFIVQVNHSGNEFRGQQTGEPLATVTGKHGYGVVTPIISKIGQTGSNGKCNQAVGEPLSTVVSKAEHLLVVPHVAQLAHGRGPEGATFNASRSSDPRTPLGTVHAGGNNHAIVAAFLAKHFGGVVGHGVNRPASTITSIDHHSLVAANLVHLNRHTKATSPGEPLLSVTAGGNHAALVYSFLVRYFGTAIGQNVTEPLFTITGKDRFGLVTVKINGETWVIVDIGMRMLTPRELARAQGFPDTYILTGTKSSQVARIGNSVSPSPAMALCAANFQRQTCSRRRAQA